MTKKTGEYKWRVSISSDTGERLSKDIGDKNYGYGAAIERMGSRKAFASISVGFDTEEEYKDALTAMDSDEFLNALQTHMTTTQSVCKFAFKNDLMVTIEMPENPYAPNESGKPSDNPLTQPPPAKPPEPKQMDSPYPEGQPAEGEFATVSDFLISVNFRESDQKKPKHIKKKFFRSIEDESGNRTGYVNAELYTDGGWKMSKYTLATKESIPFDMQWPEEYLNIMRQIDEIVGKQKLGF